MKIFKAFVLLFLITQSVFSTEKIRDYNNTVSFINSLNPYGFEYNQRNNAANLDINRDMTKLQTQEVKILINNCKIKEYDKVFDFHASLYMKNQKTVTTGIFYGKGNNSFTFETSKDI